MPGKDKNQKEKENKGLFSKFRKSKKKKSDQATTASAPASPVLVSKPRPLSMALPSSNSSPLGSPTLLGDVPKKRRAPQPPIAGSQFFPSDLSTRRRLHSAPTLDSDQMAGFSRGSSAESSLKRTKRKAPPPPTSPTAGVQETAPLDEKLQGGAAAANALEEIMEQEESTASVKSATASDAHVEDGSLNMSADASLHSPPPDTEILSTMSAEGNGEDQSRDLSSDGNRLQSALDDSATLGDARTTDGTESSELADNNSGPCPVEESTPQSVDVDCSTVPSSLPPPVMQDAEAQASVQAETLGEQTDRLESLAATSTSRPAGEDAQVQTDFTPLPVPPQQQHTDKVPSSAAFESAGNEDMAAATEEHALSHASETSSCQDSTPSAPAAIKAPSIYATNSEPKPKPSNELTRDYIPKVGMTTYTIVPQKSLEKLRYFEVALTLEAPPAAPEDGLNIGSLQLEESTAPGGQTEVSKETSELHSTIPREDLLTSTTTTTTTTQDTVNGSIPESIHPSPPTSLPKADDKISPSTNGASQAGSPTEVKEMKIPPATKPKPGSFRLAQHKKTPGYYVTSAAEKTLIAKEGSAERANLPPPPLPPPVQSQEETPGAANVELSPKVADKNIAFMRMTRQSSLPSRQPSVGLSLEKLRSFAAPRPYAPVTPSRFAQAVSSAVKRSNSLSYGPKSPRSPVSPPFSPIASRSSVIESPELNKDGDDREVDVDKGSTLQGVEGELPSLSGIVQMEGEISP